LVSSDYVNNPHSATIDSLSTMVVNKTQLKIYAWYDNEWGYACRMVDILSKLIRD
jgi:glyceraldehyde 3-phosphate dehydrogenase